MSLRFLLTVGLVVAPTAVTAQITSANASANASDAPRVGIMAGVNSSTFGGSDAQSPSRRTGFVGGLYLVLPLGSPTVAFRPEVLFSQKGAKSSSSGVTAAVKLSYVEVPLLLQIAVPTSSGIAPRLYAGPSLAFRTACRVEATASSTAFTTDRAPSEPVYASATSTYSSDCNGSNGADLGVKSFDLGGIVGAQINFDLGGHAFGVGARYTHGFSKVAKDANVRNRTISVYGSIEFPYGR